MERGPQPVFDSEQVDMKELAKGFKFEGSRDFANQLDEVSKTETDHKTTNKNSKNPFNFF